MAFGEKEDEIGSFETTKGLGVTKNSGSVRAISFDRKIKTGLSKRYKHIINQTNNAQSGLTSLAFTPVQGIELHNPHILSKDKSKNKYFDDNNNRYMFVEKEKKI